MKGFESRFEDLPDYILQCTQQIWEGRDIAAIDWHYGDTIVVRTPAGAFRGNATGKINTLATLTEFPDRQLLGEDVIWCGNDLDGYLSSHRIFSTATHRGGTFGPATGRRVAFRTIADTFCHNNRVWDEWLVRDNSAIALQLGLTAQEAASAIIHNGDRSKPLHPDTDIAGPYTGKGTAGEWGERHADLLRRVMSDDLSAIQSEYDRACHVSLPGGVEAHGIESVDTFWLSLRSAFPSAKFTIHHQMDRVDPLLSPRSAIRWSLTGRHDGIGAFGHPTGADVHVMGVSHAEFGPWGLRRETTLIDEVAIWKQILLHTGACEEPGDD